MRKDKPKGGAKSTPARHRGLRAVPPSRTTQPQPRQRPMIDPDEDYVEGHLDLNRYLVKHPLSTFYVRVDGNSMIGAGIESGSILVVDRSLEAKDGDIVIARIGDELCVKRLSVKGSRVRLVPENKNYQPIEIVSGMDFEIWGKVTHVITSYPKRGAA